jgi:hypothetical protein
MSPNEVVRVPASGMVMWGKQKEREARYVGFQIQILYWDINDNRYRTVYQLLASEDPIGGAEKLANGLFLLSRHTQADLKLRWWPFPWPGSR